MGITGLDARIIRKGWKEIVPDIPDEMIDVSFINGNVYKDQRGLETVYIVKTNDDNFTLYIFVVNEHGELETYAIGIMTSVFDMLINDEKVTRAYFSVSHEDLKFYEEEKEGLWFNNGDETPYAGIYKILTFCTLREDGMRPAKILEIFHENFPDYICRAL